jgi:hypothetical protein
MIVGPKTLLVMGFLGLTMGVMIWCGFLRPAVEMFWFFARPFAVLFGVHPRTAYDYVVRGWKAERRGDWATALAEYDKALGAEPEHQDATERRATLLAARPELLDRAK